MGLTYVIDKNGNPLMPSKNGGWVRKVLKDGKAKVINRKPFTIQLLYDTKKYVQPVTIGVDSGYTYIGISASNENAELFAAQVEQENGMVERNKERLMYRRQRRSRLRYRAPRFNNRVHSKKKGWIAPSLQRKEDTHIKYINMVQRILPVDKINIEIGLFDQQQMKANQEGYALTSEGYQQGPMSDLDVENVKAYVRYRDNYTCQNPNCICHKLPKEKREKLRLEVHHLGFWKKDRTNRPDNLITLCELSHTPENHQRDGFLWGWNPKKRHSKEPAFMNTVANKMVNDLKEKYPDIQVRYTYGYFTNMTRKDWGIQKSHINDAFCIAQNQTTNRCKKIYYKQVRRNNRSLETFRDAIYIDTRSKDKKEKKSGKELFCGRTTRNKNLVGENLKVYRGEKVRKGTRLIRRKHYDIRPGTIVKTNDNVCKRGAFPVNIKLMSKGVGSNGRNIMLEHKNKKRTGYKTINRKYVDIVKYPSGAFITKEES